MTTSIFSNLVTIIKPVGGGGDVIIYNLK